MKKLILILMTLLVWCGVAQATGNVWTGSNVKAVWNFEQNGDDNGPVGTNDLADVGTPTYSNSAGTYKQGSYSANIDATTDGFSIADANLSTGFPWKNGSTKDGTFFGWVYFGSDAAQRHVFSKSGWQAYKYTDGYLYIHWNSGDTKTSWKPTAGQWYWIAIKINDTAHTVDIRYYDAVADTWTNATQITGLAAMTLGTGAMYIGNTSTANKGLLGYVDEIGITTDQLSDDDCTKIVAGTYGSGTTINVDTSDMALANITMSGTAVSGHSDLALANLTISGRLNESGSPFSGGGGLGLTLGISGSNFPNKRR